MFARREQNGSINDALNIPKKTIESACRSVFKKTGADKLTTKKTSAFRRAGATHLEARRVGEGQIKKMLHHKDKNTTDHYIVAPPIAAMYVMAGCEQPSGLDYDVVWGLAGEALRTEPRFKALLYAIVPWLAAAEERFFVAETDACDINIRLFLQQVKESSAQFIEGAAWFKIKNIYQDHTYLKYPPFTSPLFITFVELLRATVEQRRPNRPGLSRAIRYVKAGDVIQGMKDAANSTSAAIETTVVSAVNSATANLTTNVRNIVKEELVRIVTPLLAGHQGVLAPAAAAAAAAAMPVPPPAPASSSTGVGAAAVAGAGSEDPKNMATWTADFTWTSAYRPPLHTPITFIDLYKEWHLGREGSPALKHLELKYGTKWRRKRGSGTAFTQNIRRIKQLVTYHMTTEQEAVELHKEYLEHHGVADADLVVQREKCYGWPKLKSYYNNTLTKRKDGFVGRSGTMKKRRKAGHDNKKEGAAATAGAN